MSGVDEHPDYDPETVERLAHLTNTLRFDIERRSRESIGESSSLPLAGLVSALESPGSGEYARCRGFSPGGSTPPSTIAAVDSGGHGR